MAVAEGRTATGKNKQIRVDNQGRIIFSGLQAALDSKVSIDGSTPMTGNLDMSGNKVVDVATPTLNQDAANKAYVDNQVASIPAAFSYQGSWDASTNTPTLIDGTGTVGDLYKVSVAGSQDLGSGTIVFNEGDHVVYDGATWENFGAGEAVSSVNGQTGVVVLDSSDVGALPISGGTLTGPLVVSTSAVIPITTIDTSGGGAGVVSISDPGSAMTNGARVGYKLFGGATDSSGTIQHSAGMEAHATENWTSNSAGTSLSFDVTENDTLSRVTVFELSHDGTADFKSNKLIAIANGTDPSDGVNFGQLAVERTSGDVALQLDGEELIWPNDVTTGKLRLYNSTPESTNTYYGFGVLNQTLVYQTDASNTVHRFQGVDGSDSPLIILELSYDGGLVSHRDLHMSEQKVINMGDPDSSRDGVNLQTLDARLSDAQRIAIDALTGGSTAADIVNALQAT